MRGAARATQPQIQKAMFDIGVAVMNPLLTLLEVYKNQVLIVSSSFLFPFFLFSILFPLFHVRFFLFIPFFFLFVHPLFIFKSVILVRVSQ